jgi:hypothetical protein
MTENWLHKFCNLRVSIPLNRQVSTQRLPRSVLLISLNPDSNLESPFSSNTRLQAVLPLYIIVGASSGLQIALYYCSYNNLDYK